MKTTKKSQAMAYRARQGKYSKPLSSQRLDRGLFVAVIFLVILGVLVLASVSAFFSQEKVGRTTYYLFHQLTHGLIPGIILAFIAFKLPLSFFKKWALWLVLINLLLMILVFIPGLGIVAGGAPRWLNLHFFSFQPSEFLKLTFILYLSAWLATRTKKKPVKNQKGINNTLLPFFIITVVIIFLLAKQSDVSTLVVIIFTALLMYFLANTPLWHIVFMITAIGGIIWTMIRLTPYRMERIRVFLGLIKDPMGLSYQIEQALITIGSGGIFGLGLGLSSQKFGFIPQTMSDSIFTIIAEEMGLIGSLGLIFLFLIFFWRGFKISKTSQDKFSRLFAIGISSWIIIQAFVNIGAMIGILPLTGIPLPFISYGGSHLVVELIGVGILLNISKRSKK